MNIFRYRTIDMDIVKRGDVEFGYYNRESWKEYYINIVIRILTLGIVNRNYNNIHPDKIMLHNPYKQILHITSEKED